MVFHAYNVGIGQDQLVGAGEKPVAWFVGSSNEVTVADDRVTSEAKSCRGGLARAP